MKTFGYGSVLLPALALLVSGCGKPQNDAPSLAADATGTVQEISPGDPGLNSGTNAGLTGAAEFSSRSLASPFASAELPLKQTFNRALIAFQIGDYPRAVSELSDLVAGADLNPEQLQAVRNLLAEIKKADPSAASADEVFASLTNNSQTIPEFPLAANDAGTFSTADPAIRESFARAKAAFDIADYPTALAELKDLAANAQLNYQQKYAVQVLLDKTPQPVTGQP